MWDLAHKLDIDFTAATLLTRFSDQKVAESVERVLKLFTEPKAREIMEVRAQVPSITSRTQLM